MWRDLTFCQFFFNKETRKLTPTRYVSDLHATGVARRTQHDISENLIVSHLDVPNSNTQAENLLELELDGGANLGELVGEILSVRDGGGEFAGYTIYK
jgi:hypothetical protein